MMICQVFMFVSVHRGGYMRQSHIKRPFINGLEHDYATRYSYLSIYCSDFVLGCVRGNTYAQVMHEVR